MTGGPQGPTRGAFEQPDDRRWDASPRAAMVIRGLVAVSPLVGAFIGLFLVSGLLIRPPGRHGLAIWFLQALVAGSIISTGIQRLARRVLPLASLFTMSLIFPDRAPSRFGVALRAGTVRRLREKIPEGGRRIDLGDDVGAAAARALAYVTALGRHDRLTRGHTERVRAYADLIGSELGLSEGEREKLTWGVMLHDIGKIEVPGEVLNKTTELTDEEWATLKYHPEAGGRLLEPLREWLGPWALAASEHHERWDGAGYPRGLRGSEISLAGRITAVADTYDVITSSRSYKDAMSPAAARRELVLCAGSQFDPEVVRAFLNVSLGQRWGAGVLAAASHLPLGNIGAAPVAASIGAVASVGALITGVPAPDVVETLAFDDTPALGADAAEVPETSITTSFFVEPETSLVVAEDPTSSITTTTSTTSTELSTTATEPSSTTTTAAYTTTTTAAPTTTTTAPSATTTAAPTTAPSTTTSTTAPSTTTTAPPPGGVYYLDHTVGWLSGSTEGFRSTPPTDPSLADYDETPDAVPGMRLEPTSGDFDSEKDPTRNLAFVHYPGSSTLTGPVTVTIWAATDVDLAGGTALLEADLARCAWGSCTQLAVSSAPIGSWVGGGFQSVTLTLTPAGPENFAWTDTLVVRMITRGAVTLHLAYDAVPYPATAVMVIG